MCKAFPADPAMKFSRSADKRGGPEPKPGPPFSTMGKGNKPFDKPFDRPF